MARARNIKPSIFKNEVLGVADPLYTLLFEGLWVLADREGRMEDRPLRIKAEVFPYREGLDIVAMLDWLEAHEFIQRYQVAGKGYILVLNFVKHQNPHKNEAPSELPAPLGTTPEEIGKAPEEIGTTRADSPLLIPDSPSLIAEAPDSGAARVTKAGAICIAMKAEGIANVNPGHPELGVLIDAGAEVQNFVDAARKAKGKANGFAYAIGVVKGQMADAARLVSQGLQAGAGPPAETTYQRSKRELYEAAIGRNRQPIEAFDVTPIALGREDFSEADAHVRP